MSDLRDPLEAERLVTEAPEAFHTRRDFLKRTAVTAGLTASVGLVLNPDTLAAETARRQRQVALPSPRNLPIDTFVVLMMENRSFDHYLGWLPGADGRQAGLQFTDKQGQFHATHRLTTDFQGCGLLAPDHSWEGGRTERDGGRMDGFLKAASDVFAIGYYTGDDLPFTPPSRGRTRRLTASSARCCPRPSQLRVHARFQHTSGVTLMDRALTPQLTTGRAYQGTLTSSGRPSAYGAQTVCAYLEDSNVGRVCANDESGTVNVSAPCTAAGRRYDSAVRALSRARRSLRHAHGQAARTRARRLVARRARVLSAERRHGVAACRPGVAL